MDGIVIVGAGHAGVQAAESVRAGGYTGPVLLLGEETGLPYQRPPLSKEHLAPGAEPDPLPLRGERFYRDHGIELRSGVRVRAVDRAARGVLLGDGSVLSYSALVLATGAGNRTLDVPGADLAGVCLLRTLEEARDLRSRLAAARSAVVVGAGFIGLEFAAAARGYGVEVTVLEAADRPMGRVLSPAMADHFTAAHARMGTDLRLGESVERFEGAGGRVAAAVGTSGVRYPADLIVVGVGALPRTGLARDCGLGVADGIVVDECLRTTDPAVFAIGDCANFPSPHAGGRVRLESVQNAADQARHVARVLLGDPAPYTDPPWFWSNQGGHRLQIAGAARRGDRFLVQGEPDTGRFSVFSFAGDGLTGVESVNRPADHMAARRLFQHGLPLAPEQVQEPGFSLKEHVKQAQAAAA